MTGSTKLTLEQRTRIVVKVQNGLSMRKVALEEKVRPSTVSRIMDKYRQTRSVADMKREGRPRKTTARQDRSIIRMSLSNRILTAVDIRSKLRTVHNLDIGVSTVKNRLCQAGLKSCRAANKPLLTVAHRKRRMAFAKAHRGWTPDQWKQVLWSDESSFNLFCGSKRLLVRRRPGDRFHPDCLNPTVKHGGGSLMIWGCMSGLGVGQLYRCTGSMNQDQYLAVLKNHMLPSARTIFGRNGAYVFQQDNAPCHKAKRVCAFLTSKRVQMMDWPPQSPDLNPIEHLWEILFRKVQNSKPASLDSLWNLLLESWNDLDPQVLSNLVESMPRRVEAVIQAKGGHTKY